MTTYFINIKHVFLYLKQGCTNFKKASAWLLLICFLFGFKTLQSQNNNLSEKAKELIYSNPNEAIKIGEHILKTTEKPEFKAETNLLIAKSHLVKGDYNKAVEYAFNNNNLYRNIPLEVQIEINLLKAKLLRLLYLDKQSKIYLLKSQELSEKVLNSNTQDSLQNHIMLERILMQIDRRENSEALIAINETNKRFEHFLNNNKTEKKSFYLAKERAFSDLNELDSAFVYIDKALALQDSTHVNNLYEKAIIYKELGHLYLQQKAFKKSEENLFIALRFAEIINNPTLMMQINRDLAINYLASNQKNKHKVYNDEFLVLNNQVELIEQKSINTVYNMLSSQEEAFLENENEKYRNYQYMLLAIVLLVFIIAVFILLKSEGRKKRLREIINYLEISRTNLLKTKPSKKINTKRIIIPEETEQAILAKLKRFEASEKYLNKDMSLAVLSGQFETNTKYLSEIINKHYNDNFNTFINKLRINYIIEKLKNDTNYMNYKISFLAEESGFSSHSSFATVFKSIIGMSPATFINLLKTEREEIKKESNA